MRGLLASALVCACAAAQPKPGEGSIEGRVVHALTNAPLRRATVALTGGPFRLVAETDADGKFDFTALPPGSYRLTASRTGFRERRVARLAAVGGKERVQVADIRLAPQGVIAGRVVDEAGEPADRARVWVFKRTYRNGRGAWDQSGTSLTNDRGEYRFANLKPGRYILQARNEREPVNNRYGALPNEYSVAVYYPNATTQEQAVPVEVGVGTEASGMDIRLAKAARPPSFRVRGRIIGLPPDSPMVVWVGIDSGSMTVRAPDFAFNLGASPGPHTIRANEYSGEPTFWGSEPIVVTGEMSGVVVPLRRGPVITGRIRVAEEGAAVKLEAIRVILTQLEGFTVVPQELQADASGRFVSKPVRPDRYTIRFGGGSLPDGFCLAGARLGEQEISPIDFEIQASATLDLVLGAKAGTIAGVVVDAEEKAFAGPAVTLIPHDGYSWPAKTTTDEAGRFQFGGLRPGKYTLLAWEEADDDLWPDPEFRRKYAGRAVEVEVKAGETQQAQLRAISTEEL